MTKREIYRQNSNSLGKVNRECLFFVIRKTAHRLESQSCKLKHKALISWSASSVSERLNKNTRKYIRICKRKNEVINPTSRLTIWASAKKCDDNFNTNSTYNN